MKTVRRWVELRRAALRSGAAAANTTGGDPGGDSGMTMVELVVSFAVMTVVMTISTAGILQVYRNVNVTEAMSSAATQVNTAFLRLDKDIRYAAGISSPGAVGSNSHVEFLISNTGTPTCVGLRLNAATRQIQRRSWVQGATPGSWLPLASQVTAATPFTRLDPDGTVTAQRLRVTLTAASGTGAAAARSTTDVTFTAMNTSLDTASDTVCSEGRT